MTVVAALPLPRLGQKTLNEIVVLTDDALASSVGVIAGFTLRHGGVSEAPYNSLNLASHVGDNQGDVQKNRELLLQALNCSHARLLNPNQVHGTKVITVESSQPQEWRERESQAAEGADGIIVNAPETMALLCFADCLPAIIVSPTGRFAVVHAGWRGALAGIVGKAIRLMEQEDQEAGFQCDASWYNLYVGPHISQECFEVSEEIALRFQEAFGPEVLLDWRHVSLSAVVGKDASAAGLDSQRMVDVQMCTVCNHDQVFSYRASGGVCGRHAAFGIRR